MEQSKKTEGRASIIFSLIFAATYLLATLLLKRHLLGQTASILIAILPVIAFAFFIFKYVKAVANMDEVRQRVQFEAVIIGFSLTVMLLIALFLLSLTDISYPEWFGYSQLVIFCWLFYFIGWLVSKKKYGI
ncbi:hypothetical protein [Dyadobacter luticola]|uniref:Uncharacterized protein n=1 Tax=Dyadobacter luticola TaxID=1979387 RepID=A0A5R9L2U6_9BACT|nr:hypothetical protein [Dyadobacter luticola]TLV02707.1 hypothetical protein FEN17_03555 [Dyadobacter luticola]